MADDDADFDRIKLTFDEQFEMEMQKQTSDLELEAAIHDPQAVIERRARLIMEAASRGKTATPPEPEAPQGTGPRGAL